MLWQTKKEKYQDMALPRFLKNFDVNLTGFSFTHRAEEITLPKITVKTEEWRGSGMDAPVEIDMGLEKLEATFKFADIDPAQFVSLGIGQNTAINGAIIKGSIQRQGESPIEITGLLTGWIKELDMGSWKVGDMASGAVTLQMAVSRYSLNYGAMPLINIDIVNGVRLINAIDQNLGVRQTLGVL